MQSVESEVDQAQRKKMEADVKCKEILMGLRSERELLGKLIRDLEAKPHLDQVDMELHEEVLKGIETNLKFLRTLKRRCPRSKKGFIQFSLNKNNPKQK